MKRETIKIIYYKSQKITLRISDPDNYLTSVAKTVFCFEKAIKNLDITIVSVDKIDNTRRELSSKATAASKNPEILVLFLKKTTASLLIDKIINDNCLPVGVENQLFVNTLKMWVGTTDAYNRSDIQNEFSKPEYTDSFVKEYDYVALKFSLPNKNYSGYNKNDGSYERNMFFKQICSDGISLLEYSKTLSFDNGISNDVYDV